MTLDAYRKLMGISPHFYPEFKAFNRRVIKEPVEEINRVTDFLVQVVYQRKARQVVAVKFKVQRLLLLPGQKLRQQALFSDLLDISPIVRELKEVGLSGEEAWRIWQAGFNYVDGDKRPVLADEDPEAAFTRYVREKIHLLQRLREQGKVRNTTGFLLEALKKNYSNPEFAEEEKQKAVQQQRLGKKERERQRQRLEEEKRELEKARDGAVHETCKAILRTSPHIVEEAVARLLEENPTFRQFYDSAKSVVDNYQRGPRVWVFVDQYVRTHYAEQFEEIRNRYDTRLVAIGEQLALLQQTAEMA